MGAWMGFCKFIVKLKCAYLLIVFTRFANFDFRLEALFLWMIFFFANLSSIATTFGNNAAASFLSSVPRNFFTALRVVFA